MSAPLFRVGARGSKLSLAQTSQTCARLAATLGLDENAFEIVPIVTSGDRIQDRTLIEAGGKGLFTKELDEALFDGRIDLAVHSLKDLPTRLPHGIVLACVPEREDPRDAFVSLKAKTLADLPAGAVVGTASLRRQAQVLFARPDLRVSVLRGNVDTRLAKLEAGDADATFLALAGLKRMGLEHRATSLVEPEDMLPAACQGAIAITAREDNMRVLEELARCEDYNARVEVEAERGFLDQLDGSCRTPIGALARLSPDRRYEGGAIFAQLTITGEVLLPDGTKRWRRTRDYQLGSDAYHIMARERGEIIAREILDEAGDAIVLDT